MNKSVSESQIKHQNAGLATKSGPGRFPAMTRSIRTDVFLAKLGHWSLQDTTIFPRRGKESKLRPVRF
jgi:hypothetical protein